MGKIYFPIIYNIVCILLIFMGDNSNLRLNDHNV